MAQRRHLFHARLTNWRTHNHVVTQRRKCCHKWLVCNRCKCFSDLCPDMACAFKHHFTLRDWHSCFTEQWYRCCNIPLPPTHQETLWLRNKDIHIPTLVGESGEYSMRSYEALELVDPDNDCSILCALSSRQQCWPTVIVMWNRCNANHYRKCQKP